MAIVPSRFSVADITDVESFRKLGSALAANPEGELNRTIVSARVVVGPEGIKRTELVRSQAADRIRSTPSLVSADELRRELAEMILASLAVPARKEEGAALKPLLDAFLSGLGSGATEVLSANLGRAGARLIRLVEDEQRRLTAKPSYQHVVGIEEFNPIRTNSRSVSRDRWGPFSKAVAYEGWTCSLFDIEWFDSEPERAVANMLDVDEKVERWVRLHIDELPILWSSDGRKYNPDFIVVEVGGTSWVVEVKMNREMASQEVQDKREAAMRWANHVSADGAVSATWRYLLVSQADVETAKESWAALKRLGQA
jgi:type III restriction enzyme